MIEIKIKKDINPGQMLEELKAAGIDVEGISQDKDNNLSIMLINDIKETALRNLVMAHVKIPELTRNQRIDSITNINDIKKYLKGE